MTVDPKQAYMQFAAQSPDLPLFLQPWWLDTVAGPGGWTACVAMRGEQVVGVWPVALRKSHGFSIAGMLHLTPYLGPWLQVPADVATQAREKARADALRDLLEALPRVDLMYQTLQPGFTDSAEFNHAGFTLQARHTRIIADLHAWTPETHLQPRARTKWRKALASLRAEPCQDLERVWALLSKSFARQGLALPVPKDLFTRIWAVATERDCLRAWVVVDSSGRDHACSVVLRQGKRASYLIAGQDPEFRDSGAGTLAPVAAIAGHQDCCTEFDLEGSMIPGVDTFLASLGGSEVPMWHAWRNRSKLLKLRELIRQWQGKDAHP